MNQNVQCCSPVNIQFTPKLRENIYAYRHLQFSDVCRHAVTLVNMVCCIGRLPNAHGPALLDPTTPVLPAMTDNLGKAAHEVSKKFQFGNGRECASYSYTSNFWHRWQARDYAPELTQRSRRRQNPSTEAKGLSRDGLYRDTRRP